MPRRWTKWMWKSYADLGSDVQAWAQRLPPISAVAGVPRSGVVVASQLAMSLNVPLLSLESLTSGVPSARPAHSRSLGQHEGRILIVDDTCHGGRTMRALRSNPALQARDDLLFGAIYCAPRSAGLCDVWGFPITSKLHTFEWNYLRDCFAPRTLTDMDGVLCDECPAECDDGGERYADWARNVKPRVIPLRPVDLIVSARLQSIYHITQEWLARHGIRYRALAHLYPSKAARAGRDVARDKARVYMANKSRILFIESSVSQAERIFRFTRRPVLCTDNRRLYQ